MYEVCLPPEDPASGGEEESEDGEHGIANRVGTMVKIFHFIMKQSYICALIAMMVSSEVETSHLLLSREGLSLMLLHKTLAR